MPGQRWAVCPATTKSSPVPTRSHLLYDSSSFEDGQGLTAPAINSTSGVRVWCCGNAGINKCFSRFRLGGGNLHRAFDTRRIHIDGALAHQCALYCWPLPLHRYVGRALVDVQYSLWGDVTFGYLLVVGGWTACGQDGAYWNHCSRDSMATQWRTWRSSVMKNVIMCNDGGKVGWQQGVG